MCSCDELLLWKQKYSGHYTNECTMGKMLYGIWKNQDLAQFTIIPRYL